MSAETWTPTCPEARAGLSALVDGEVDSAQARDALGAHTAECASCRGFLAEIDRIRRTLRFEAWDADQAVDLTPALREQLEGHAPPTRRSMPRSWRDLRPGRRVPRRARPRWRRVVLAPTVVAFTVGAIVGGIVVAGGDGRVPSTAVADMSARIDAGQRAIVSLDATLAITEHGWYPDVPVRHFSGTLRYERPESIAIHLDDRTVYPDARWAPADADLVVDGSTAWSAGLPGCPVAALPACADPGADGAGSSAPNQHRIVAFTGRPPYSSRVPSPLEVVIPVRTLRPLDATDSLPIATIGGREVFVVDTTVSETAPLLDGLRPASNWRELYRGDAVLLFIDVATLVPVGLEVRATASDDRARWGVEHGYADRPGMVVLDVRLGNIVVNAPGDRGPFPPAPAGVAATDLGFVDARVPHGAGSSGEASIAPSWLPEGMSADRRGVDTTTGAAGPRSPGPSVSSATVATVATVASWSDGRAWITVASTSGWTGRRLFGGLGDAVRPVDLGASGGRGIAHLAADGTGVAVHGAGVDIVVRGTVSVAELERVAASIGVAGLPVPLGWAEASTTSLEAAADALPGLLVLDDSSDVLEPAVRLTRDLDGAVGVTLSYVGAGERALAVEQRPGLNLAPPIDPDARTVVIDGPTGPPGLSGPDGSAERIVRIQPGAGIIDWVERNGATSTVVRLSSATMTTDELVEIARHLEPLS